MMQRTSILENGGGDGDPLPKPKLSLPTSISRGRIGLLTQSLLSTRKGEGDCDLSPNSIRNFMNPFRSQLGLKPFTSSTSTHNEIQSPDSEAENENLHATVIAAPELIQPPQPAKSLDITYDLENLNLGSSIPVQDRPHNPALAKNLINPNPVGNRLGSQPNINTTFSAPPKNEAFHNKNLHQKSEPVQQAKSHDMTYDLENMNLGNSFTPWQGIPTPASATPRNFTNPLVNQIPSQIPEENELHPCEVMQTTSELIQEKEKNHNITFPIQNHEPISSSTLPGIAVAARITQKQLSRSAINTTTAPKNLTGDNKIHNKNNSGLAPLRGQNHATEPGTPILKPPHFPMPGSKTKPKAKRGSGSGWKFSNEMVAGKEYLILEELGKGGCGQVFLVMEKETRRRFALKKVSLAGFDPAVIQECINEVEMLVELKDTELVIQIDSWERCQTDNSMKIVMEVGGRDLSRSMIQSGQCLHRLRSIWKRLLQIVEVIHSRGIVHGDLKPANFVWVDGNLKIIDFGIANRVQTDHTSIATLNPKGTLNFISPETIRPDALGRTKIGPKSDIWSLGCILYLMVYGKTPFQDLTHHVSKMNAILTGAIDYPTLPPVLESSSVISVLKLCFQLDSRKRPTASDLLKHPFFYESSYPMMRS